MSNIYIIELQVPIIAENDPMNWDISALSQEILKSLQNGYGCLECKKVGN